MKYFNFLNKKEAFFQPSSENLRKKIDFCRKVFEKCQKKSIVIHLIRIIGQFGWSALYCINFVFMTITLNIVRNLMPDFSMFRCNWHGGWLGASNFYPYVIMQKKYHSEDKFIFQQFKIVNFADFQQSNITFLHFACEIMHLKKWDARKSHISRISCKFCLFSEK